VSKSKTKHTRLTLEQERFIRLDAQGLQNPEIAMEMYGITKDDPKYHSLECKFTRWRKHPKYGEIWKDEVDTNLTRLMAKSVRRLDRQVNNENDWIANKASNDLINLAKTRIFGDDEKTVHVAIEGLPDLGTPDDE